jgi:hypothetical protein
MTTRNFILEDDFLGTKEFVVITNPDGSETTMLKSLYEAQQVEHLTEIPTK